MGERTGSRSRLTLFAVIAVVGCASPASDERATGLAIETRAGHAWAEQLAREQADASLSVRFSPFLHDGEWVLDAGRHGRVRFGNGGPELAVAGRAFTIRIAAIGRGAHTRTLAPCRGAQDGPTVGCAHTEGIVEWWRALPSGLEHGVTLERRPTGEGVLRATVQIDGVRAALRDRDRVELRDASGALVATYARLLVLDADDRIVPAQMETLDGEVAIAIDDRDARYPLIVDPLVATEEAMLEARGGASGDDIGRSVAISADGTRAIIGAPRDNFLAGSAHVYVRSGTRWVFEATLPMGGASVAITADGSRVVVGNPSDTSSTGSARVFLRNGTSWSQEALLISSSGSTNDQIGASVSITADGTRAILGAPGDDTAVGSDAGGARVFLRSGSAWTEEATLLAPDGAPGDNFGSSVALAGDGTRALIGAPNDDTSAGTNVGTARVFLRNGTAWMEETTLAVSDAAANDNLGSAVAFDGDGDTAAVGARLDDTTVTNAGSVRIFARGGTVWMPQTTLTAPVPAGEQFGTSVALAADGSRAIAGAPMRGAAGGANVFLSSGGTWMHEAALSVTGARAGSSFGTSVALSGDAALAMVGGPFADSPHAFLAGGAAPYARGGTSWSNETLELPGGENGDLFGAAVAISADGTRAIVGASNDDTAPLASTAGNAWVFVRSGSAWNLEAVLVAPDAAQFDKFGTSVALSADGSRALIGASGDDTSFGADTGSARVFVRNGTTWMQEAVLIAPDAASTDQLGSSVAFSADGSRAIVGALLDDTAAAINAGTARVFVRNSSTWTYEATLTAALGGANDQFGSVVAMSADGSRAIVGAPDDDTASGADAGSATVFVRAGTLWSEEATLLAPDGTANDSFGSAVAFDANADRAFVGAPGDAAAVGINVGSVRIFSRSMSVWMQEAAVSPAGAEAGNFFGSAISASSDGSRAAIGTPGDASAFGPFTGSVHMIMRAGTSWTDEAFVAPSDLKANDRLGQSVSLSGDGTILLVGMWGDDTVGDFDAGSARVFTLAIAPDGTACASGLGCASGTCVDGVCCADACAGGPNDCLACSIAAGGTINGSCTLRTMGTVCRATSGPCDAAESCSGTSSECPPNDFAPSGTICRPSIGVCDAAETCSGTASSCPSDVRAVGMVCRPAADVCDVEEKCTATSISCPLDVLVPAGLVCRASAGACDVAEQCDGTSVACPDDAVVPSGLVCREGAGDCDVAESCTGSSAACPPDAVVSAGVECRAAVGPCDVPESCDGAAPICGTNRFALDGTSCADTATCNGEETCRRGVCTASLGLDCDDSDLCTTDSCAEPTGCDHTPIASCCNNHAECDDSDACTTDRCSAPGGTCSHAAITDCCADDGDCADVSACTADTCESSRCAHTPIGGCCASDTDCADGNACTTDRCGAGGLCELTPIPGCCASDGDCDDGDACTNEACTAGSCEVTSIADCCTDDSMCDDSDVCTTDSCQLSTNRCLHAVSCVDAGPSDAGAIDGGTVVERSGCGCRVLGGRASWPALLALLLAIVAARRRRAGASGVRTGAA